MLGVLLGYLLKTKRFVMIHKVITGLIWILLFLLGLEVGGNERIVHSLPSLGLETVGITVAALLGSMIAAWILSKTLSRKPLFQHESNLSSTHNNPDTQKEEVSDTSSPLRGSAIIILFFLLGVFVGYFKIIPLEYFLDNISYYALCMLMFSVGFGIGNDPQTIRNFRSLNPSLVFLPFMTIIGTLAGCAVLSLLFDHRSLTDYLAIGSGFGYYSLSSIFITEYKGVELGTIALLSNITREIFTLLGAPLMVRYFGRLAPISAGGATTMDTTLPIITRCSGQEYVVVSVFHGFVVDLSVPFLVTFFCSI